MKDNKKSWELTEEERTARATLTPKEQKAVDAFVAAAKALPASICIDTASWADDEEDHLTVSKRITKGHCRQVASLNKRSLIFA